MRNKARHQHPFLPNYFQLIALFGNPFHVGSTTHLKPAKLLLVVLMLLPFWLLSQEKPSVTNLHLSSFEGKLEFHFTLKGNSALPVPVHLYFYDSDYRLYRPLQTIPEQGSLMSSGTQHSMLWENAATLYKKGGTLTPVIITGNPADFRFGPGPEAALLSLVIPGLGDYVIGNTSEQTIQPWMRTVGAFGLLALGLHASEERYRGEPIYWNDNRIWKSGEIHYRFFRNDAELLIGAGIAIWVADVIWVSIRGNKNRSLRKNLNTLVFEL